MLRSAHNRLKSKERLASQDKVSYNENKVISDG